MGLKFKNSGMGFVRNILGRVFAFWAMLTFIPTMLVAFIPIALAGLWPEPTRTRIFQVSSRIWMRVWLFLVGIRLVRKGKNNFAKDTNYIVVCNHNSFMDVPISTPFIPGRPNKSIAKIEMAKIPLFGLIYTRGAVLVDRKNDESRKASYLKMKQVLELGMHMCVYPEGTRNKTKEPLQPFHNGAFRLAADTGKAIIPTLIFNTGKILPRKTFYFWPYKVEMHFLEPVLIGDRTVDQLKESVFNLMKEYYVNKIKVV